MSKFYQLIETALQEAIEYEQAISRQKEKNMSELKRCPFCGGEAKYRYSMPYNAVQCKKCKVFGKTVVDAYEQRDGKQEAIDAWNRRVQEGAEHEATV